MSHALECLATGGRLVGVTSQVPRNSRAFVKKTTGGMSFAYDDDHHLESLRKVARQTHAWLQEQKTNSELAGRQNAA